MFNRFNCFFLFISSETVSCTSSLGFPSELYLYFWITGNTDKMSRNYICLITYRLNVIDSLICLYFFRKFHSLCLSESLVLCVLLDLRHPKEFVKLRVLLLRLFTLLYPPFGVQLGRRDGRGIVVLSNASLDQE